MSQELEQLEPAFVRAVQTALREYDAAAAAERVSRDELMARLKASDCVGDVRNVVGELWQHEPSATVLALWNDLLPFLSDANWATAKELALDAFSDR